jgi:hypothetical protein
MNCPNCSNTIDSKTKFCSYCDAPVEDYVRAASGGLDTVAAASVTTGRSPVASRYIDLYRAARLLVGLGSTVKVIGIIFGIGILLLFLLMASAGSSQPFGFNQSAANSFLIGISVIGAVLGAFVGGVIFLFGTLISAQGQLLMAHADSAVHTSPFLSDEERAAVMSLPYAAPAAAAAG